MSAAAAEDEEEVKEAAELDAASGTTPRRQCRRPLRGSTTPELGVTAGRVAAAARFMGAV